MADHFPDATKKMDFISREAAYKTLTEYYHHSSGVQHTVLRDALNRVPTADVRPVVRARWEDETGYIFINLAQRVYCPACKSYAYFYPITAKNFCPNCGADMREGENG